MSRMVKRSCDHCGKEIEVKQADIERGWGRHCSKSCAAYGRTANRSRRHRRLRKLKRGVREKETKQETVDTKVVTAVGRVIEFE
jgi:hypothetical protein